MKNSASVRENFALHRHAQVMRNMYWTQNINTSLALAYTARCKIIKKMSESSQTAMEFGWHEHSLNAYDCINGWNSTTRYICHAPNTTLNKIDSAAYIFRIRRNRPHIPTHIYAGL